MKKLKLFTLLLSLLSIHFSIHAETKEIDQNIAQDYAQAYERLLFENTPLKISIDATNSEIPFIVICDNQTLPILAGETKSLTLRSWKPNSKIIIKIESKDLNKSISFNLDTPNSSDYNSKILGAPFPLEESIGNYHLTIVDVRRKTDEKILQSHHFAPVPRVSSIEFIIPIKIKTLPKS